MVVAVEFVMDASFAISWVFRDEANQLSDEAWGKLVKQSATAHVPGIWAMEIVNVTLRGPREGKTRPSDSDVAAFFSVLRKMPLRFHFQGLELYLDQAAPVMKKYGLTSYDASYLLLAKKLGLPLASNDKRMRKAAKAEGIEVVV